MNRPAIESGLPHRMACRRRRAPWPLQLADTLLLWLERSRQRRALHALNDHMLKDLGLSRADATRETGKRFWEG